MDFHIYGTQGQPTLLLLPGLGVSHEIFLPLIERLQDKLKLCPSAHVEIFEGMNHGQLLIDHPDEVAKRIMNVLEYDRI